MKRPEIAQGNSMPSLAQGQESVVLQRFPHICDLILDPNWADLNPKGQRTLMVFIDDVSTRLLVKMEADCLKCSVPAKTLDEALAALELLLTHNQVVWEQDRPSMFARKKKGK